ncbi:MAG: pyridoxal phosphate-dependent aminotransferase [Thermogutta sp.]
MSVTVSRLLQTLEPSATLAMAAKAKELKMKGQTVFDLSLGEPDFATPEHICQAAIEAMRAGYTHYTQPSGIPELKQAIVDQYKRHYGLTYSSQQVVVSNGAKHALHNVFTTILNPGDEVIIPGPYWVSYSELIKLTGAVPVVIPTEEASGFKLTAEQLRQALTPKTRVLLLCTPSNPTGTFYSRSELEGLANVVVDANLTVVADEIYDQLVYLAEPFVSFPTVRPGLQERTILINGVSKTYAMTGWRIGWAIAPNVEIAKAMGDLQSQETSNPCSISQHAALAALNGPQECVEIMRQEFARRRDYVAQRLASIPSITFAPMQGAFYAFVNISQYLGKRYGGVLVANSSQWCLELLAQKGVATVMGSAFGAEGYARLSFAASMDTLAAALDRIDDFLREAK